MMQIFSSLIRQKSEKRNKNFAKYQVAFYYHYFKGPNIPNNSCKYLIICIFIRGAKFRNHSWRIRNRGETTWGTIAVRAKLTINEMSIN